MRIFISYRRSDSPSASRQLAETLKARFGAGDVFFDTRDVPVGTEWRREALRRVRESDVLLVVIGPHWVGTAHERLQHSRRDPAIEDVVRSEVETAFADGRVVIPVLVDDAKMPGRNELPLPFKPLADVQAHVVHHSSWQEDADALGTLLQDLARRPRRVNPVPAARPPLRRGRGDAERIACHLAESRMAIVLGTGTHAVDRDRPWRHGAGSLPDAAELAHHLAGRFRVEAESDDLARVAEHVSMIEGRVDLSRTLRELLVKTDAEPGSLHRMLAHLPGRLRAAGREGYQLVVTAGYDTALERAFDAAHEPYDLVVFAAAGEHRGRFVHVPWDDADGQRSGPIHVPNEYVDLPIDEDGAPERTVILKLHGGALDVGHGPPLPRDNFVITEDDYIGYLSQSPVAGLVPLQILNKVRDSHFLFLGYRVRDWTLRVFLQRIWREQHLEAHSWAVEEPALDAVEHELWERFGVDVLEAPMADFLADLEHEVDSLAETLVEP